MTMQSINDALIGLQVGEPISFRNMTVTPLLGEVSREAAFQTLDEALEAGSAEVTEVSDQGSVPELRFRNRGETPVLLLDGEELIGAKQNRVLNLSILAPAEREITIPVSCVEAGRWKRHSARFSTASHAQYASGRAAKARHVSGSLRATGTHGSNQAEIWQDIAVTSARLGTSSSTGAMADSYEQHAVPIDEFVENFAAVDGQQGALFEIGGAFAGIDLFDSADTFGKLCAKLVRSYALDALMPTLPAEPSRRTAAVFLDKIRSADAMAFPAVGLGKDLRLEGSGITGGALVVEDRCVHLCAFPVPAEDGGGSTGS